MLDYNAIDATPQPRRPSAPSAYLSSADIIDVAALATYAAIVGARDAEMAMLRSLIETQRGRTLFDLCVKGARVGKEWTR